MSKPVENFFRDLGYEVYCEVPYYNSCIDMVIKKNLEICCVELKRCLSKKLVLQCQSNNLVNRSIGFVCSKPRKSNKYLINFKKQGLWLYYLDPKTKEIILINKGWDNEMNSFMSMCFEKRLFNRVQGGVAGHKMEKNSGPCYPLALEIIDYRKNKPKATWRQIFKDIPNQYSNYISMRSKMSSYIKKMIHKTK